MPTHAILTVSVIVAEHVREFMLRELLQSLLNCLQFLRKWLRLHRNPRIPVRHLRIPIERSKTRLKDLLSKHPDRLLLPR